MDSITVRGNDSAPLEDWDKDGIGFNITPSVISDAGSGNNGYLVEEGDSTPDTTGGYYTFEYTSPGFHYTDDVGSDGSYIFYAQPVDRVGNFGPIRDDNGSVDELDPSVTSTDFTNEGYSPNWFDQGTVANALFEITFVELNVYSITVTVTGGIAATGAGQDQATPFTSSLNIGGKADGTYSINVTIIDKAGRITLRSIDQVNLDDTAPSISVNTNFIDDSSTFLFWDSGNSKMWYGDDMSSAQSFTIGVDSSDLFVGLKNATVSNQFGGTAGQRTDSSNVSGPPTYNVPVVNITNTSEFSGNLVITVYDLLGNANTTNFAIDRDTVAPSGYSLDLILDSTADIGYIPNNGFYDDDSVEVNTTESGMITETGSGLPTNSFAYQIDTDGWSSWNSSNTFTFFTVTNGAHNLYVHVRDNVGNNGTAQSNSTTVDTTSPSSFTLTWDRAGGFPDYAEVNSTHIIFNSERDDYFTVTVNNDGTIGTSAFWKIEWDKEGVFETATNDTSGLPDAKDFYYFQDSDGFLIIRLVNNAGNYYQWNYTASAEIRIVSVAVSSVAISESSPYLYHDGSSSEYGYYSNNMPSAVTFTIGGTASTSVGFISLVNDSTTFGANPENTGSNASWSFVYTIDSSNSSFGTFSILFTAFDNIGNSGNDSFEFRYDNSDPETFLLNLGFIGDSPNSPHLYYDGSSTFGFYSNNMDEGGALFYVGGNVGDLGSGILTISDNTTFGGNPDASIGLPIWTFMYNITPSDSSYNNITVMYTATDNVGNNATITYDFIIDNTDPSISFEPSSTSESSEYLYYDGSSDYGYYSDNMGGSAATFTIGGSASDSNVGLYTIIDSTGFGGNPIQGGTLANWTFDYDITDIDSSYGNFTVGYTAIDLVGNIQADTFEFRVDNTNPVMGIPLIDNPSNSDYIYITSTGDYFFFSDNMGGNGVQININGTANDVDSQLKNVSYTSHFGNSPGTDIPGSIW
ncbi:MAG: beta strand repeat-containing protein, partial [Candidatus Kariarchaeaceae archaeon]